MAGIADIAREALEGTLYALDTPGALTRGVLTGRPGRRATGREMLESWGLLDENQEGLDVGDVAGFGAELVADPLNWLGAGLASKAFKAGSKAAKAMQAGKKVAQSEKFLAATPPIQMMPLAAPKPILAEAVQQAAPLARAAETALPWQDETMRALGGSADRLIPEQSFPQLFEAARRANPDLTPAEFRQWMQQQSEAGKVALSPFTQASYEMTMPELAIRQGDAANAPLYYARARKAT